MTDQIKKLNRWAWFFSIVVPGLVLILLTPDLVPKLDLPFSPYLLPKFHASVNALTVIVLLIAVYFVKKGKIEQHQKTIYVAIFLSILFLISYVLYHWSADPTKFGDLDHNDIVDEAEKLAAGSLRMVYYFFLISHILLSAIVIPFVLFTFVRGYTNQIEKHKKLARFAFPLWLYVAASGVITYLLLSPYYP